MPEESITSEKEVRVTTDDKVKVYKESQVTHESDTEIHTMTDEDGDLETKARKAGSALQDLITSAIDKAKVIGREKAEGLAKTAEAGPGAVSAASDSRDISRLGPMVEDLARAFEDTMTEIRKQDYEEQEKLLVGYRKLLEEQVNVINSTMHFAKRVK